MSTHLLTLTVATIAGMSGSAVGYRVRNTPLKHHCAIKIEISAAQERDFTLVFRTFGTDIEEVVDEISMFATGQHPDYPNVRMDGSDGRTDLRMFIPGSSACFVRTTAKADGSLLLLGEPFFMSKSS